MNKAILPLVRKGKEDMEFPFSWEDDSLQHACYINYGYWNHRNYMVLDVLGYFFLLKEGGNVLPERTPPIFDDLDSIETREKELNQQSRLVQQAQPITTEDISIIQRQKYWVKFDDSDFRRFTSLKINSNEILKLLLDTSRVEFKLVYPVRLRDDKDRFKENSYIMNFFSRLFEFGYINKEVRSDGIVRSREYYIVFNTILGELFVNNMKTHNFDLINNSLYNLPYSAQILYRRLLVHNDLTQQDINLETIKEKLNLEDENVTNLRNTIELNALEPLKQYGFITDYRRTEGLNGVKYSIWKPPKTFESNNKLLQKSTVIIG
jgi:hypothetical protein